MINRQPTTEQVVSIAFFLVFLTALVFLAVMPFYKLAELKQEYDTIESSLATLDKRLAREGRLREENKNLIAVGQDASLLLKGETIGIAGADLQRLMNRLILENKGTTTTSQILSPKEEGDLIRISMSLALTVDTDGLRDLLYNIETGSPLIFIDQLSVNAGSREEWARPDPHFMGPLEVTLQVSAYTAKREAS